MSVDDYIEYIKENSEELHSKRKSPVLIDEDDELIILSSQKVTPKFGTPDVDISQVASQRPSLFPVEHNLEPALLDQTLMMTIGVSNIQLADEPMCPLPEGFEEWCVEESNVAVSIPESLDSSPSSSS